MRYFVLPFSLSIPLAVPLLWYHLDGMDPVDIGVRAPSQEELDFAATQELMREFEGNGYTLLDDEKAESSDFIVTVDSLSPGY
ncbi:hypothetical protein [Pelagibius sp. Alg239-R121]|uniref:hypothetical protein n=1 Tax=Pelagibius sp. Alg239-R121 TaxID=2993448 RepID=UPI0024A732B4|nr:hypothetical protein [Pelagibius sp. Alg239-R121]